MKSVLILDPHIDQAAAFARLLQEQPEHFRIIGWAEQDRRPFLHQSYYDEIIFAPFEDESIGQGFDFVLPTGADSTYRFITCSSCHRVGQIEFRKEALRAFDKRFLLSLAESLDIPIPTIYDDPDKIERFPIFVKDAYENQREVRLRNLVFSRKMLPGSPAGPHLIQEYIQTPYTFGVGFLADRGKILTSFIHKELVSLPRLGGSGVILQTITDARLLEYSARLLRALNYSGWGLTEFKYCNRRRDYVLMELNAKFWESLEFALRCNADFFRHLFCAERPAEVIPQAVFLKRFMKLSPAAQVRFSPQLLRSYWLDRDQLWPLLLTRYLPEKMRLFIKKHLAVSPTNSPAPKPEIGDD